MREDAWGEGGETLLGASVSAGLCWSYNERTCEHFLTVSTTHHGTYCIKRLVTTGCVLLTWMALQYSGSS